MKRKEFLKIACGSVTGMVAAGFIQGCSSLPLATYRRKGEAIAIAKSAFAETTFVLVQPEGFRHPIYLRRFNNDLYAAVLLQCTHKGCEVSPYDDSLECPCHGSTYSPDGKVTSSPATKNLTRFHVTTENETILIHQREFAN